MNGIDLLAVDVQGAEKSYGKKSDGTLAFTDLNLKAPRGNIYALLGPSGCGKTTLLRCILGRLKLDKGTVSVFGHPPGSKPSGIPGPTVGYLSQVTAVYQMMTIGEYLWYYGTILGMSYEQLQGKTKHFIELLKLPPKDTVARTLSGGELRRLQFAAAVIHEPKLIILDEPTVGVDVITKFHMWEHLVKMTKIHESTIILTTHYIEEARLADRVGMIHNFTMAAEDTMENLLRRFNGTNLEDVFLKICQNECPEVVVHNCSSSDVDNSLLAQQSNRKENDLSSHGIAGTNFELNIAWHRLYPIVMRCCIYLYRFPGALLVFLFLPCIQVILYRVTMGSPVGGIPLIIVNEDTGQLGARFLSYLSPDVIIQQPYPHYDVGLQALRQENSYGIIRIKSNFSSFFYKRFTEFNTLNVGLQNTSTILIQMDNTYLNLVKFAEFHMLEMYQLFFKDTLRFAGINPLVAQLPIKISKGVQILTQPPSSHVVSALLTQFSYFSAVTMGLFNVHYERIRGFMEPNLIAGVTPLEIVLGINLFQAVFLILQVGSILLLALPVLKTATSGSLFLLFCLLYVQGFGGTALGICTSMFAERPTVMMRYTSDVMCFAAIFGALFWPFEAMPSYFRYFSLCLPYALPSRAGESIIRRGWGLSHFYVYSAFAVAFIWIFILLALSLYFFYRKNPTSRV